MPKFANIFLRKYINASDKLTLDFSGLWEKDKRWPEYGNLASGIYPLEVCDINSRKLLCQTLRTEAHVCKRRQHWCITCAALTLCPFLWVNTALRRDKAGQNSACVPTPSPGGRLIFYSTIKKLCKSYILINILISNSILQYHAIWQMHFKKTMQTKCIFFFCKKG